MRELTRSNKCRSGLGDVVVGGAMLEVFDDQTVGVAQSGARADWSRPPLLNDFGAGGDLPRDRLVEIGVENGDGGLCSEAVLFGVELKDEKRSDGDDVQAGPPECPYRCPAAPGSAVVEAHGVDQLPGFAEHSGEDPRSGEVGGVGVLSVDAGHSVRLPPTKGTPTGGPGAQASASVSRDPKQ